MRNSVKKGVCKCGEKKCGSGVKKDLNLKAFKEAIMELSVNFNKYSVFKREG